MANIKPLLVKSLLQGLNEDEQSLLNEWRQQGRQNNSIPEILKDKTALAQLEKVYDQIDLASESAFLQLRQDLLRENGRVNKKTARIFLSRRSTVVS